MKMLLLLVLAAALLGCDSYEPLLTEAPSKNEVEGRYDLTYLNFNKQLDAEIQSKASSAYIELNADGTMKFHNVPIIPESRSLKFTIDKFHSGVGTYRIEALGSTSSHTFYGLYINCGELPDPIDTPRFRGSGDSLTLSFDYFDGDFVPRMSFTRAKEK